MTGFNPTKGSFNFRPKVGSPSTRQIASQKPSPRSSTLRNSTQSDAFNPFFKKLSEAEWKAKKEKELCFRCDGKYSIGHQCKNKELQTLGEVQALGSLKFQLNLIAIKNGIQKISGFTVFDTVEKKTYDSLLELEIYVDSE
ncbi:unnamed protein product [Fraxinus pennsylvanica]|uniref:Trafficking protein particle complex subunit 13 C-terminal domain-containing protein n=1 Tax=Fraxinus pennsylvanica TaxID=56036 RepID=A0AAD1YTT0_9LAMI|nr:unnamed protein product [Fraxinus pennsylvanica]